MPLLSGGLLEGQIALLYLATARARSGAGISWAVIGGLVLMAAACTIACGLMQRDRFPIGLMLSRGLALGALGAIHFMTHRPIGIGVIAFLLVVLTASTGAIEFGRKPRGHAVTRIASAFGILCCMLFAGLAVGWIPIAPGGRTDLLGLGCTLGAGATCMLGWWWQGPEAAVSRPILRT